MPLGCTCVAGARPRPLLPSPPPAPSPLPPPSPPPFPSPPPAQYAFSTVVGLNGYTALTFDAAAQAAFVAGIAVLGGFETNQVEVTAVTNNKPAQRRELLQTLVGRMEHVVISPGNSLRG